MSSNNLLGLGGHCWIHQLQARTSNFVATCSCLDDDSRQGTASGLDNTRDSTLQRGIAQVESGKGELARSNSQDNCRVHQALG
jgi:hypothetical protein